MITISSNGLNIHMLGYNIIFDPDNKQLGFSSSTCNYETFGQSVDPFAGAPTSSFTPCLLYEQCTAKCTPGITGVVAGEQEIRNNCDGSGNGTKTMNHCHVACDSNGKLVKGNPKCPDTPWTECSTSCQQTRVVYNDACAPSAEARGCSAGVCPIKLGDFIVLIDIMVPIAPSTWSYVHSEDFLAALESLFNVPAGSIDLLNDASKESSKEVRLHFEVHLSASNFRNPYEFHQQAEMLPTMAKSVNFSKNLIQKLDEVASASDKVKRCSNSLAHSAVSLD